MHKSDSIKNVMTALGFFQAKALKITKDATNPHFKSKYASLAAILDVIQPILTECKLVFTQVPEESTHLVTMLFHTESGEYIESRYELKAAQVTPQGIGSAITYARRYSLTSLLGLNIDDDDDGNEASKLPAVPKTNAAAPPQQQAQATPAQTPFNKTYSDNNAVLAVLNTVKELKELTTLYAANKAVVDAAPTLQQEFKRIELSIKNGGKLLPTDNQIAQVCDRILKGDAKAFDNAVGAFVLNAKQLESLQKAANEAKQLEEALKTKYSQPADIATVIEQCRTPEQLARLHGNNALIIDRDPDLTNKINGRIRILKTS